MVSSVFKTLLVAFAFSGTNALPQQKRQSESVTDNTALLEKLMTDATAIKRLQRLLTKDGKELISPEDLVKATTFDFNKDTFPVPASQGGVVSSVSGKYNSLSLCI